MIKDKEKLKHSQKEKVRVSLFHSHWPTAESNYHIQKELNHDPWRKTRKLWHDLAGRITEARKGRWRQRSRERSLHMHRYTLYRTFFCDIFPSLFWTAVTLQWYTLLLLLPWRFRICAKLQLVVQGSPYPSIKIFSVGWQFILICEFCKISHLEL